MSQSHENYAEFAHKDGPSNRSFGLTVGGILAAIGLYNWLWKGSPAGWVLLFLLPGLALVIAGLLAPQSLHLLNTWWMRLALLMARIVNPVLMLLIFVAGFLPFALFMRLIKRDVLKRSFDRQAETYWVTRPPQTSSSDSMKNQF